MLGVSSYEISTVLTNLSETNTENIQTIVHLMDEMGSLSQRLNSQISLFKVK